MRTYPVDRPETRASRVLLLELAMLVVVSAAMMAAVYRPFNLIPVEVDRSTAYVPWGSTVGDLVDSDVTDARDGDLIAADDGSVVETGAGDPLAVWSEGRLVDASERLYPGDDLRFEAGADVTEPTITTETVTEPPVVEIGEGPIAKVLDEGMAGRRLVTLGAVSGHEVSSTLVTEARPARVMRWGGGGGPKVIALTFDDGPWPGQTEQVLAILRLYDVKATFFMLGINVHKRPALAAKVAAEGHQIGNHTWSHRTNAATPWQASTQELAATQRSIYAATGVTPKWFRPPGGLIGPTLAAAARSQKLDIAMWTVDPWDWNRPGAGPIVTRACAGAKPGGIILLHDGGGDRSQTVGALPYIIRGLRREGYTFVTLDELAAIRRAP